MDVVWGKIEDNTIESEVLDHIHCWHETECCGCDACSQASHNPKVS